MPLERIVITLKQDGTFRGASSQDHDGLPQPLDEVALAALFPTLNAAAINFASTAEAQYNAREPGTKYIRNIRQLLKDTVMTNRQMLDAIQLEVDAWATAQRASKQAELEAAIATANAEAAAKEAELLALANEPNP